LTNYYGSCNFEPRKNLNFNRGLFGFSAKERHMKQISITLYEYIVGYAFSLTGSFFFVRLIVDTMWRELGWKNNPSDDNVRPYAWHGQAIGLLESVLFEV
jgi:hypothetical protein